MQEIFTFEKRGLTENGVVKGVFRATGIRPHFAERLAAAGYRLRASLFDHQLEA
jgi:pilus assembly protein CpaF